MVEVADAVVGSLAFLGSVFVLLAGVGVLRFRDVYARMHAATKATTLGLALIGTAVAVALGEGRGKVLLAVAFVLITSPTGSHFVGRAAYRAEGVEIRLAARDDLADAVDEEAPGGRTTQV